MNLTAEETALDVLGWMMDARTLDLVQRLVVRGDLEWAFDPEIDGVVAAVLPGTRHAAVIVYDADFETDDVLLDDLAAKLPVTPVVRRRKR
jgi:hypothetical protein